ncbi:XdhC/CoxI family protein [Flammeovirga sp. SubArs3]|uniref:XdhC family protein n=1 Tax=Flammeovirga sp. SubArs3 TaxID=2995316 RepID=UPI00248AC52A|nr:XdhC/CoxI family protein [Flammeovirga sp. SubArs3]
MLHELKDIVYTSYQAQLQQIKCVLVSVVALNGSSYRKPGVRMLLLENGKMIGAVSGGCVENEIKKQAKTVFETSQAKMMEYDGRFRLGCEGVLQILIEPFYVDKKSLMDFNLILQKRLSLHTVSYYSNENHLEGKSHTRFSTDLGATFSPTFVINPEDYQQFSQTLSPEFQLYIFGTEHDSKTLCQYASITGWNVTIIDSVHGQHDVSDFPGAQELIRLNEDEIEKLSTDQQTAIVIMTHSFVKDLKYLLKLSTKPFAYLGVLGAKRRKEKLINQLFEYLPTIDVEFVDKIHSPCGLDIGAITPQEISISIMAEILAVCRNKQPMSTSSKIPAHV